MLDIKYIKEKPQEVIDRLAKKGKDAAEDIQAILDLDAKRRELIAGVEAAKARSGQLWDEAEKAIEIFGERAWFMHAFAKQLRTRKS